MVISRRERLADLIGKKTVAKTGAGDESHIVFPEDYLAGRIKLERQEVGSRISLAKLKFHC